MNTRNGPRTFRILAALAFAAVVAACAVVPPSVLADEEQSLRELADATREKAARVRQAKLRHILARQQGDQLKVYLKGSDGIYVNGTSISSSELATIIRESGLNQAIVTAELEVLPARVTELEQLIKKHGVENVESRAPLTLREVATASREGAARHREANLRQILARQKGDQLNVHLKGSLGIYVNGTSISSSDLLTIIRQSRLDQAIITADLEVLPARVTEVAERIQKSGVENVESRAAKLTLREVADASRVRAARNREATLREILAHQSGDVLRVYLRNGIAMFVNSRQISAKTLATVVRESGLEKAVISAEQRVPQERLKQVREVLQQNGATDITVSVRE